VEPRPENVQSAAARPAPPRYVAPGPNPVVPAPLGPVPAPGRVPAPEVFSPARIAACAVAITEAAAAAAADGRPWCAETAAQRAAAIIRASFPDERGDSSIVLVRIFQTCVWESLTTQLRSFVLARLSGGQVIEPLSGGPAAPGAAQQPGQRGSACAGPVPGGVPSPGSAPRGAAPQGSAGEHPGRSSGGYFSGPDTAIQDAILPGSIPPGLLGQSSDSQYQGGPQQNNQPPPVQYPAAAPYPGAQPPAQPTVLQGPATQRADLVGTPCLALLATDGERPSWTDRRASLNHQALPLNGPEVLERVPLVLTVLGDLVGAAGSVREQDGRIRLAVHPVPRAAGSPLVPAQWLIAQHSVVAALGLGGLLPNGEAFTLVFFSRAALPAEAATAFRPLVQALHALLAPLAGAPLFEPAGLVGRVSAHEGTGSGGHRAPDRNVEPVERVDRGAQRMFTHEGGPAQHRMEGRGEGWPIKPLPSVEAAMRDHRAKLAQESRIIETLYSVGQTLAKQLDLSRLVRTAIEAATSVVGARFGAFFYTVREPDGLSQVNYALAGLPPDSFDQFPLPRAASVLSSGALISSSIRLADVTEEMRRGAASAYPALAIPGRSGLFPGDPARSDAAQPGFGRPGFGQPDSFGRTDSTASGFNQPGPGADPARPGRPTVPAPDPSHSYTMPRHLSAAGPLGEPANPPPKPAPSPAPPVRSYLAVPVIAASGELLGSFYFGHPDVGVFTERDEQLAKGVAAQAASAMDNARLYRQERTTAMALQTSLLPTTPPQVGDLEVASSYLPGEQGSRVGGDWFDVIALSADRIALVIGDVMGRGIEAAAVMGQLRAAIQAYAVMDLPPAQILDQLNRLVCQLPADQIATCVYAVFDPGEGTVRWSNAGHLPPLLAGPDGQVALLDADLGMPLGVDQAVFAEAVRPLPAGSRLLLYTDGLVECRDQSLADRLGELRDGLAEVSAPGVVVGAQESCKFLINTLLTGTEHDDVAVLLITVQPATTRSARLDLAPTLEAARTARGFIRSTLITWQAEECTDTVVSVASELVNNAAEHAGTPLALCLRQRDKSIVVEVSDGDGRLVRPTPAGLDDERHRGLVIVSTLAKRWGVRPTETGKTVWAELAMV
jgi:serine phosphatase RsbU (regulator of sigma subunit)